MDEVKDTLSIKILGGAKFKISLFLYWKGGFVRQAPTISELRAYIIKPNKQ